MGIPINPALISAAAIYQMQGGAIPVSICQQPFEGPKALSMQFEFADSYIWSVSLQQGLPAISQISSAYIDATGSANNVYLVFPDTGFQVKVSAGKGLLCPIITGKGLQPFYVILDSGQTTTSDIVNLILLNFFVPEFSSP